MGHDVQHMVLGLGFVFGVVFALVVVMAVVCLILRKMGFIRGNYVIESMREEGLVLKMSLSKRRLGLGWEQIRALVPTYYGNTSLRKSKQLLLQYDLDDYCSIYCRVSSEMLVGEMCRYYLDNCSVNGQKGITDYQFGHSEAWKKKANQPIMFYIQFCCMWIAAVLFFLFQFYRSCGAIVPYLRVAGVFTGVVLLLLWVKVVFTLQKFKKEKTLIASLGCDGDSLYGEFCDGERFRYLLADVVSWDLEPWRGELRFRDGGKLTDLEKTRYWFVLYEYLSRKLIGSGDAENA